MTCCETRLIVSLVTTGGSAETKTMAHLMIGTENIEHLYVPLSKATRYQVRDIAFSCYQLSIFEEIGTHYATSHLGKAIASSDRRIAKDLQQPASNVLCLFAAKSTPPN
jgi:hypothetical protein